MSEPSLEPAAPRSDSRESGPLAIGLLTGMGWGIVAALVDGLPLLLRGSPAPYLGPRLLALALMVAIYGGLGAVAGLVVAGMVTVSLRLSRRRLSAGAFLGVLTGLFAAGTVAIFLVARFSPDTTGWGMILALAALVGLGLGWLFARAAGGKVPSRSWVRGLILATYLTCLTVVLAVAGFRALLRDLPLFSPDLTDEVASVDRPNILLITASGLRPDHLGAYGYDPAISPNADALAQRGVRFEEVVAQSSWSGASVASMLTSLYPTELGIACRPGLGCRPHLDGERTTIAEALSEAGYSTYAYVTSPALAARLGFDQGFDRFEAPRDREPFDMRSMRDRTLGWVLGCDRDSTACHGMLEAHARLFDAPMPSGPGGDDVVGRVARFLELHRDERFFLWVHLADALPPYDAEAPFHPLPEGPHASREDRLSDIGFWELGDPFTRREKLLPEDARGLMALYDGEVHGLDRLVGELVRLLEVQGLTERSVVVLTSDHGQEFAEHGAYTYGHTLYDEVVRVPLIVAGPGVATPGRSVSTPVGLLDLAPTLVEIAGAARPPEAGGRSLAPALRGEALVEESVFSEGLMRVPYESKAIRKDGYKLIYRIDEGRFELFDLAVDPAETQDLADEAVELGEAMMEELLNWMDHAGQVARDLPRAVPPTEFKGVVW